MRERRAGDGANERKTVGAASKAEYRTRPELAVEMLHLPGGGALGRRGRTMHVLGDSAYGGTSVTRNLPPNTVVISRVSMKAALYDLAPTASSGGDVRAKKGSGCRLPRK